MYLLLIDSPNDALLLIGSLMYNVMMKVSTCCMIHCRLYLDVILITVFNNNSAQSSIVSLSGITSCRLLIELLIAYYLHFICSFMQHLHFNCPLIYISLAPSCILKIFKTVDITIISNNDTFYNNINFHTLH